MSDGVRGGGLVDGDEREEFGGEGEEGAGECG